MKMTLKKKNYPSKDLLLILSSIQIVDTPLYGFLLDHLECYQNKTKLTRKIEFYSQPITSFILYLNIFSTRELNLQLTQQFTTERRRNNLIYQVQKKVMTSKRKKIGMELQRRSFLDLNGSKRRHILFSRNLTADKNLKKFIYL